ncbi:Glycine-rich RNA-binding protein RZ1C-like protein [Drosera capensis]
MVERETGRPRGFGFLTFSDHRGMEDAIREMHGREFGDRVISVNKAVPKPGDDSRDDYGGGNFSAPRGGYRGSERSERVDECFKCGRLGHWARDCPSAGGGRGGGPPFSSRLRYEDNGGRFGDRDRYVDDRYDGGRYGERDLFDSRDKYAGRDRFASDRYPPAGDRYGADRYRGPDRYAMNGYDKERGYERDGGPRRGSDRYASGGPVRDAGRSYSDRPVPYDHPPSRGRRLSSYERY